MFREFVASFPLDETLSVPPDCGLEARLLLTVAFERLPFSAPRRQNSNTRPQGHKKGTNAEHVQHYCIVVYSSSIIRAACYSRACLT